MRRFLSILAALALLLTAGCRGLDRPFEGTYDQVLIYCALGYNNLSPNLVENFAQIQEGILPGLWQDKAIVAFVHTTKGNYSTPNPPRLIRIYRGPEGKPVADTLKTYDNMTVAASKESLQTAFSDIMELFPAHHYGMIVSSHGTGWIPGGYTSDSEASSIRERVQERDPAWPATKAFGAWTTASGSYNRTYWMEFSDFVDALPMKLDYLVLDACLMGTVEVAWDLKDICRYVVFSPTEVMEYGMIYKTLSWDMLSGKEADLLTYCKEFYDYYRGMSGSPYGTITLVDCTKLEPLADAFGAIVAAHRDAIGIRQLATVQRYYYASSKLRFYYDLRDFAEKMDATSAEMARLDAALADCVLYHAETPTFFDLPLERCCGLSSYIPDPKRVRLNAFYQGLGWNRRVRLVE